MASLQILKSSVSPFSASKSNSLRKHGVFSYYSSNSGVIRRRILKFQNKHSSKFDVNTRFRVSCKVQDGDKQSNGEEPPESLFMKELRRRGMTPTSILEESNRNFYTDDEKRYKEEDGGFSNRNTVSTDLEKSLSNQRQRSMALNSEGLEGLIPRGKLLLTLGGTFFFAFWPLILITVACFAGLYLYFGTTFIHDGTDTSMTIPQYVDPYALLEDERISQAAPSLN